MPYHPGGIPKLMLGSGKDCTVLFNKYHSWVNCESILAKCLVGTLADESISKITEDNEEELDENDSTICCSFGGMSESQDNASDFKSGDELVSTAEEECGSVEQLAKLKL